MDLRGFRVAITANRLVREQTILFERLGATVAHLPLVELELTPEDETLAVIAEVIAKPPRVAVFSTGLGVRWLFSIADASGVGDDFRAALADAHVVARGPKARGALAAAGVLVDWVAPDATAHAVIERLRDVDGGDDLFVQLDGSGDLLWRHAESHSRLWARPYTCFPVSSGPDPLTTLAEIQAITFTSPIAVRGLENLAGGSLDEVLARLAELVVVAVGPVTGAALRRLGVTNALTPIDARLGAMVRTTGSALSLTSVDLAPGVELQGTGVVCDGELVQLSTAEARLLRALAETRGVVAKRALARAAGIGSDDPHAVEALVTRVRRRLGPAAHLVETVPRRGYRLATSTAAGAS
jgi:uroporphyrinogen-III synthase